MCTSIHSKKPVGQGCHCVSLSLSPLSVCVCVCVCVRVDENLAVIVVGIQEHLNFFNADGHWCV